MKKTLFTILAIAAMATAKAGGYSYLTFETTDGRAVSVPVASVSITLDDARLKVADYSFAFADLKKMYFSEADQTTGVDAANVLVADGNTGEAYDLQGRKMAKGNSPKGVFVVRTKSGIFKTVSK